MIYDADTNLGSGIEKCKNNETTQDRNHRRQKITLMQYIILPLEMSVSERKAGAEDLKGWTIFANIRK